MYKHFFKRVIDFTISLLVLLLIWWIIVIVAIWLHFANKGAGAFFLQERPGKGGKIFKVIKFKTMTGRVVRSLSIDELPQLIYVLKGDMALIGPRPLLVAYLHLYTPEQARRHEVRPGITGWAQVHGRNLCKLSDKFKYDVWYVDHCTLATDIRIILMTVMNVLKRSDIGEGASNMKEVDDLNFAERMRELRAKGVINY